MKVSNVCRVLLYIFSGLLLLSIPNSRAEEGSGTTQQAPSLAPSAMTQTSQGGGGDTVLPDSFTGTMSYSVPILVPAGRNGMDPGLSLLYRSSNGNGWLGVGWELEVGAIERSTKGGVDYNGDKYLFRMAGGSTELVNIGGNEYRAKIEGAFNRFRKLTASNGSPYWEVTDRKGTRYLFGEPAPIIYHAPGINGKPTPPPPVTPRQDDQNNPTHIFKWCLDYIVDTNGNFMTFNYFKDQGQIYLDEIDYNGNYVKFYWEGRSDAPVIYTTNFAVKTALRLKTIEVVANGNKVRAYKLSYQDCSSTGRSLLASVQQFGKEYGLDGSGTVIQEQGTSLPAMTFNHSQSDWANGFKEQTWNTAAGSWGGSDYTWSGDFNGDGRTDIATASGGTIWVKKSVGYTFATETWATTAGNWGGAGYTRVGDFNGDGKTDIATASGGTIWVKLSTGTSFTEQTWATTAGNWGGSGYTWVGDFDGDGKMDIATASGCSIWVKHSTGTSFVEETWTTNACNWGDSGYTWVGDFDGDGKMDIATAIGGTIWVKRSTGSSFIEEQWATTAGNWGGSGYTWVGDFNGDGKTDIATASGGTIWVKLSTGTSFTEQTWATTAGNWGGSGYTWAGDFDGDGKMDIATANGGTIWVKRSTGSSFVEQTWAATAVNWGDSGYTRAGDFNGDGKTDLVTASGGTIWVKQSNVFPIDLLTTISNGLGATTTITYTPSTNYQNALLPFPIQTVSSVTVNDGNGNVSTTGYSYSGGYFHIADKDFRGFNYVRVTGTALPDGTTPVTETWFHQGNDVAVGVNNPNVDTGYMKGKPYRVKSSSSKFTGFTGWYTPTYENRNYSITETTYAAMVTGPYYYFAPPASVSSYICNGALDGYPCDKVVKTEYDFDNYGNLWQEKHYGDYLTYYYTSPSSGFYTSSATSDDRTTVRTYALNPTNWIVGLPATETVYQGIGTTGAKMAQTNYYYDQAADCDSVSSNQIPDKGKVTRVERWKYDSLHPEIPGVVMESGRMAYDTYGNLKCSKDARGNTTSIAYDGTYTFPKTVTNPLNQYATTSYYGIDVTGNGLYGQVYSVTDPNGAITYYEYDPFGRKTKTTLPDGTWSTTFYNSFGSVGAQHTQTDTSAGLSSWSYFDGVGRNIIGKSTGPDGKIVATRTIYDNRGTVKQSSLPYFDGDTPKYTTYTYDILGRVIQADNPDSTKSLACYYNWTATTIDANNHAKTETKDAFGRLVRVDEYTGTYTTCSTSPGTPYATTTYQYDVLGNLLNVTDAKGNISTMNYDTLGRKVYMKDPDMGQWYYAYDNAGNLINQHDSMQPNNQWIYFQYDALNRLRQKDYSLQKTLGTGDIVYTYDEIASSYGKGRLTTMKDQTGETKYYYNIMGQSAQVVESVNGSANGSYSTQYAYDQLGRPKTVVYPDMSSVNYLYNGPLLAAVYDGTTTYATYSGANALGQPGTVMYGNGVTTNYTYYSNNYRLNTIKTATYQDLTYFYDNVGNVKSITDPTNVFSYDYDELNRLKVAYKNSLPEITYSYDTIGNMTYNSQVGTYTYPANGIRPHAVTNAGSLAYTYDNNGNMRTGAGRTITPDPENRPGTIIANGLTTTFDYDGNGERVKKTTNGTATIYIGKLYECVGTTCYKYIFANGQRIARKTVGTAETRYYHTDHLGSSSVVTNETGAKVEDVAYYPYGSSRTDTDPANMRHKFTGQELDGETGLYNYNARLYDPVLGRFITADSIIPDPGDPQSFNRYSYVRNNPINLIDPSGHDFFGIGDTIGKAWDDTRNETGHVVHTNLGVNNLNAGLYTPTGGGEVSFDFSNDGIDVGGGVGVGAGVKLGVSTGDVDIAFSHGGGVSIGYDPNGGLYTSAFAGCTLCGGIGVSATYFPNSGNYQGGAGAGYGNVGVGVGYSNLGGTSISAGYGGIGANYGLQTHKTRYSISMDDRDIMEAYNNGVNNRQYGNGYGADGGNQAFNQIIDFLGTVMAGSVAAENHDRGYGESGADKATVDFGLFRDMVRGSVSNISQPAGLARAAIGLAISPLYYGAVSVGGGPAFRAGQGR